MATEAASRTSELPTKKQDAAVLGQSYRELEGIPLLIKRVLTLLVVFVPAVAVLLAIGLWFFNWADLSIFVGMYLVTALGITIGFHRYGTHEGFETSTIMKAILLIAGSMAVQGPVLTWISDHRCHHAFSDKPGDPHSPHADQHGVAAGLLHAHVGWLFSARQSRKSRFVPKLKADPVVSAIDHLFPLFFVATFAIPFGLGLLLKGDLHGAVMTLLFAGLVRVFAVNHVTWSINSVCHMFGKQPYDVQDESRNVFWLAWLSLGEAWHHNHHASQTSACHGFVWWQKLGDPSWWVIWSLEQIGLVWNVKRPKLERLKPRAQTVVNPA